MTIGKNNVWVLKQVVKKCLKFHEKYLKLVFSLFQCSEDMKLNPQQAPLYVSTNFKHFFPHPTIRTKCLTRAFWRCYSFFSLLPEMLFELVQLQMLSDNGQVSHRAPLFPADNFK